MNSPTKEPFSHLVITGGSSGIGKAILQGFLEKHPQAQAINLSRSKPVFISGTDRLEHISVDLCQKDAVAEAATQTLNRLHTHSKQGRILLINNSGIGGYARTQESRPSDQLKTIDLNISATVDLTTRLLPNMLQVGGKIINVSSTSAFQPTAYMATYGATKTFLLNWTLALGEDLRGTSVSTLAFCPGVTQTPFIHQAGFEKPVRSFWGIQDVDIVANSLLDNLYSRKQVIIPGIRNRLIANISKTAPYSLSTRVAAWLMNWAKSDHKS